MQTPLQPPQFGYFLPPAAGNYPALRTQAQLVEQLGLELIGIQDHPYQGAFLDTWTLLTALALDTDRIRFFPDVINLPLRPPVMLAKAVASLDELTGGRIELGLGAGYFWDGIHAMGGPRREPGEAVDALTEAVHILRLFWRGKRNVYFDGEHYQLRGVNPGPLPTHPIGIWLGAIQSRMLSLTGTLCDGWVPSSPYVPPTQLLPKHRQIDEAAVAAGRDPAAIRRIYNLMGTITDSATDDYLEGPTTYWVDELTRLALDCRMDTFIFAPKEASERQIRRFGEEVVPQVRENLAKAGN